MKYEEYERPEIVEIEIDIEGSFLNSATSDLNNPEEPGFGVDDDDPYNGDF